MNTFMNELSIIMRHLRIRAEHGMIRYDLGFPEQMVLTCLSPNKVLKQEAIAQILGLDKGAIARTVAKLEKKDLVEREINPSDRRQNLVSLSEGGRTIIHDMKKNLNKCTDRAFEGFTDAERARFVADLNRIADNLTR